MEEIDLAAKTIRSIPVGNESMKVVDGYHAVSICISPDEKRVHYVVEGRHWLVADGKAEELELTAK